ncbi:DUF2513 domain-containing protein [Shewanella algae]|uniref:DUF2513 domain-containing protein n=1 Tax=Shewanella algae TaxID=38313 RepID=UPI001F37D589|nr:DUF2513 domain-containing protein [Shewanella algae]MCE9780443.1 DUF2513 domain-containing protein [Shewanella algae]MCE9828549.1 DUF2513 domain-containing protein [Shewanella algae]
MKRNMDLIREILFALEKDDNLQQIIDQYDKNAVNEHIWMMGDAGLITHQEFFPEGGGALNIKMRLTWQGHEFIDAARKQTLWEKAKEITVNKTGALSYEILKTVLVSLAKEMVSS